MKLTLLLFLLFPFLSNAQEGEYQLDCDYQIEKLSDSTFKIQVANFDSLNSSENCFLMWMNTAKGKPNGKLFVYDENGKKRRLAIYYDGVRTGTHLVWYSSGELESETTWETDLYFTSTSYFKSGKIKHTAENGNRPNAVYKSYYENGQIESINDFSGSGDKTWYENGQLKLELNKIKNTYTEWYPNGKVKLKGNLINGWARIGKWIYYNEKGRRTKKLIYTNTNKNRSWYGDEAGFEKEKKY
jgi:antitoxin component YwqK of YwqJK toxin-antitoxin module